jgi:hypothetical protein
VVITPILNFIRLEISLLQGLLRHVARSSLYPELKLANRELNMLQVQRGKTLWSERQTRLLGIDQLLIY